MKIVVSALLVCFAVGWGVLGGDPLDLMPGSKMPPGFQTVSGSAPRQLSQINR